MAKQEMAAGIIKFVITVDPTIGIAAYAINYVNSVAILTRHNPPQPVDRL
jgi:hypothetical protein